MSDTPGRKLTFYQKFFVFTFAISVSKLQFIHYRLQVKGFFLLFIFPVILKQSQVGLAENADQLTAQSHTNLNYLSVLVSVPSIELI